MGEIELSGKAVKINIDKVTVGEWRNFFIGSNTLKEDDAFLEKVTGLTHDEQMEMLRLDMRRLIKAIHDEGSKPLADPNLVSPSTSD